MKAQITACLALIACLAPDFYISNEDSDAWSGTLGQPNAQRNNYPSRKEKPTLKTGNDGEFPTLPRARRFNLRPEATFGSCS